MKFNIFFFLIFLDKISKNRQQGKIMQIKKIIQEIRPDLEGEILVGEIDSIDIANLISLLEQTFDIKIPLHSIVPENFQSISSVEQLVKVLKG